MGTKKYCLGKHSTWTACGLTFVMDGHRTDIHDRVHWMVCDSQWRLHNGVEGIVG